MDTNKRDAYATPPILLETNQAVDTFVQLSPARAVTLRLLSFRCQEAQAQKLPCQDYARIVTDGEGSSICFCVCDGVGSSYNGGFAARYLATCLVDWLQTLTTLSVKASHLSLKLQSHLDQWTHTGRAELQRQGIPSDMPELVHEVLQDLQSQHGSQTVFLCGRIERARHAFLLSRPYRTQAIFCWMGNVTARIFPVPTHHIDMGDRGNDRNRWSTILGCSGKVTTRIFTFNNIHRLVVYTDGLNSIGGDITNLSDAELHERIQRLLLLPTNDDMTLLDLQWLPDLANTKKGKIQ